MAEELETPEPMTAQEHTAAALHSALDAVLADDSAGKDKAKKLAKIIKAMHDDEEEEEAETGASETAEGEKAEEKPEAAAEDKPELTEAEIKAKEDQAANERESRQEQCIERHEQAGVLPEADKIDRKRGILKHVHIAGMVSRNDGVRYTIGAHRRAAPRFEQMPVSLDHDYVSGPMKVAQAWGVLSNITVEDDGPYGDLAYLKSHERTEQVLEDAERGTGIFSLSMVAKTRGQGLEIAEYMPSRVDLVVRGATTRTLFNQEKPAADVPAVSKKDHDALQGRFEQLLHKFTELERRVAVKEAVMPSQQRMEQEINAVTAGLDMSKYWNDK